MKKAREVRAFLSQFQRDGGGFENSSSTYLKSSVEREAFNKHKHSSNERDSLSNFFINCSGVTFNARAVIVQPSL